MIVNVNAAATLDLAPFITGSFTGINIVAAAKHGTASVSGTQVTYTPNVDYFGSDTFSYVAIGSGGTSATAAVAVTIVGRPDPSKNANVIGLINSQIETAKRFANAQISNIQSRMEGLHRRLPRADAVAMRQSTPQQDSFKSVDSFKPIRVAYQASYQNNPYQLSDANNSILVDSGLADSNISDSNISDSKFSGTQVAGVANVLVSALTDSSVNLGGMSYSLSNNVSGKAGVWGAGTLRWGTRNQVSGDMDFRTDGASVGVDKHVDDALTLGMGMGYARDHSTLGTDGTASTSQGRSMAAYGSYMLSSTIFLDGIVGYETLNFENTRYVASVNDFARAQRTGNQLFGSLAAGYEYRNGGFLLSPYGRLDFVSTRLRAATETGAGLNALNYANQTWHTSQTSAGLRTEFSYQANFGQWRPHARIEYQRSAEKGQQASIAYADLYNGLRYNVAPTTVNSNALVVGLGSDFVLRNGFKFGIDYQTQTAAGKDKSQAVNFKLSKAFGG